jgi:transcriptional regulator with XRE-family HTH domain
MKPNIDNNELIGARLKSISEIEGLSQGVFANSIGTSETTYGNWERGASRLSLDGANAIRHKYEISLEFLYYGETGTSLQDKALALLIGELKNDGSKH